MSITHPWLAASPDGLVTDPQEESAGVVEYKNPYNARDMMISEAVEKVKDCCLTHNEDGHLRLKESHPYYYQVQATMFCTKRNWCDFVVNTTQDLHIERIRFNEPFWAKVMPKLKLSILMLYFLNWLAQGMITVAYVNHQNGSKANRTLNSPCTHLLQPIMPIVNFVIITPLPSLYYFSSYCQTCFIITNPLVWQTCQAITPKQSG